MSPKNNPRNWNDVQTAIATVAIVTTLGMWNLFATPAPKKVTQAQATLPPVEEIPVETTPTAMPQVKIFFNTPQTTSQSITPQQPQQQNPTVTRKKKTKNNNNSGGTVTTTRTS